MEIPASLVACPDFSRWVLDAVARFAQSVHSDLLERADRWKALQLRSEERRTLEDNREADGDTSPGEEEEEHDNDASVGPCDEFSGDLEDVVRHVIQALEWTDSSPGITVLGAPPEVTNWPQSYPQLLLCHLPPAAQDLIKALASHLACPADLHIYFQLGGPHGLDFSVTRDDQTGEITIQDSPSEAGLDWFFLSWAHGDPPSFISTCMTLAPSDSSNSHP